MTKKFTETEEWYLLSNKEQILSNKKFNFVKPDDLGNKNNNVNNKKQLMLLNATKNISQKKERNKKKRGRGIPYIYKSRIYLRKRPQTGFGAVSHVIAHPLENFGLNQQKKIYEKNKRKYKTKHSKGFGDPFKLIYSLESQWRKSMR